MSTWRHGDIPATMAGRKVEAWHQKDQETWFQMIGTLSIIEGILAVAPHEVDHMEIHTHAPCPTEGRQVWRLA